MSGINFQRTYLLGKAYEVIKERANQVLGGYPGYPDLITFNDPDRTVTFSTERLIPAFSTKRPRVMLLFSNPHPHSVHQGMFLSPNTKGRENLFWPTMRDAGWNTISKKNPDPKQLADICLKANYQGPFELIFYCYYAFPTYYPKEIKKYLEISISGRLLNRKQWMSLGRPFKRHVWMQWSHSTKEYLISLRKIKLNATLNV